MTLSLSRWRLRSGRATLLVLAVALIPLPAAASDGPSPPPTNTSKMSLKQAAAREAARTPLTQVSAPGRANRVRGDQTRSNQSTSFFKTRPAAIALAVMAVGTGYAIYSAKHDKITSPARSK